MNQSTFRESVDKIVIAHNQYIDGVWKGTSDLDNPPKTAVAISNLVEEEVKKELETIKGLTVRYIEYAGNKIVLAINPKIIEDRIRELSNE